MGFRGLLLCALVMGAPVSADPLVDEIERLTARQNSDHRADAVMEGCVFQSRRFDPMPDGSEMLVGIAHVDLRTATWEFGEIFQMQLDMMPADAPPSDIKRAGTSVIHLGDGSGALEFQGRFAPIMREEWVLRERTLAFIARGDTRPSPRGDGKTYVFRDSKSLFMSFKDENGAEQLRALETALLAYKAANCSAGA